MQSFLAFHMNIAAMVPFALQRVLLFLFSDLSGQNIFRTLLRSISSGG